MIIALTSLREEARSTTPSLGTTTGVPFSFQAEEPLSISLANDSVTTPYTITATVTFTVSVCTTSCTTVKVPVVVPVTVTAIPFVLNLVTKLQNVTCSAGCILRNADGTFYRGDAFYLSWNATFLFYLQRTEIRVNVTSVQIPQLHAKLVSASSRGLTGTFLYNVTTSHPYSVSSVRLVAEAFNSYNDSLGLRASVQAYAVVKYQPMFTYLSYMDYNYLNSSAYQRPFVTLVRYGGNQPGYSSLGGTNWVPFNALNTTGRGPTSITSPSRLPGGTPHCRGRGTTRL